MGAFWRFAHKRTPIPSLLPESRPGRHWRATNSPSRTENSPPRPAQAPRVKI